jgi:RecA/RadA recombinase
MAAKKTPTKAVVRSKTTARAKADEAFRFDYRGVLSDVERKFSIGAGTMSIEAKRQAYMSTGLLSSDLMLGGGILPGAWYTMYGPEQSAKSTHLMHISQGALEANIPLLSYWDFEGSLAPDYFSSMLSANIKGVRFQDVFGLQNPTTGDWEIVPRIDKYEPSTAEEFFNPMSSLLRSLPDKRFIKGQWFYVFENTKKNRALVGDRYSKTLFARYNRFFVEAEDGRPQIITFLDSYPAMFPDRLDDDDAGSGMAAVARMFSENVPKVLPKLKRKAAVIVGVNQLRLRPGFNMGNPEYEPAGETVKFASSVRVRQMARSVPHGKGPIEEERSVSGEGTDIYRYVHMKAIKNKVSTPYLEAWQRVWVRDEDGQAHGFDPVWDTFYYLRETGQAKGNMKRMSLPDFGLQKLTWNDFKSLILLRGTALKEHCASLKVKTNPNIRATCFKQLKSGKGMELFVKHQRAKSAGGDEDE